MARLSQEQWMSQNLGSAAQRAQTDLSPLEPADFGRAQYSSSPSFSFSYSYSYSYSFSYFCYSCYYDLLLIVIDKLLCLLLLLLLLLIIIIIIISY